MRMPDDLRRDLRARGRCSRQAPPGADEQAERDRAFEEMMTNVSLVGQSTSFGREGIAGREEYVIEKVSRVAGRSMALPDDDEARLGRRVRAHPHHHPVGGRHSGHHSYRSLDSRDGNLQRASASLSRSLRGNLDGRRARRPRLRRHRAAEGLRLRSGRAASASPRSCD